MHRTRTSLLAALAMASGPSALGMVVIDHDFETDVSADYTVVTQTSPAPDSEIDFVYDYVAAGLPLAPNSSGGDAQGVRMAVNRTTGVSDAITAFNNTPITGEYTMLVDFFIGVAQSGTTEYAHIGVGGTATAGNPNSLFLPISGSGSFVALRGDASATSDSGMRWYLDPANGGPTTVNSDNIFGTGPSNPSYLLDDGTGIGGTAPAMAAAGLFEGGDWFGGPGDSDPFDNLGTTQPGEWATARITVDAAGVVYSFYDPDTASFVDVVDSKLLEEVDADGLPTGNPLPLTSPLDGLVSLGFADVFGGSIASPTADAFIVYDNLVVTIIPEPASAMLLGAGALLTARRRRQG